MFQRTLIPSPNASNKLAYYAGGSIGLSNAITLRSDTRARLPIAIGVVLRHSTSREHRSVRLKSIRSVRLLCTLWYVDCHWNHRRHWWYRRRFTLVISKLERTSDLRANLANSHM